MVWDCGPVGGVVKVVGPPLAGVWNRGFWGVGVAVVRLWSVFWEVVGVFWGRGAAVEPLIWAAGEAVGRLFVIGRELCGLVPDGCGWCISAGRGPGCRQQRREGCLGWLLLVVA
jgi:hypothetical protein